MTPKINIRPEELYSAFYQFEDQPPLEFIKWFFTKINSPANFRLLDIGCGPGRMFKHFAAQGWQVEGREPDPSYYQKAREEAGKYQNVSVSLGGFADLNCEDRFHLISALKGPLYYLSDYKSKIEALRCAYKALQIGGVLVIDYTNFLYVAANYQPPADQIREIAGRQIRKVAKHSWDFHHGYLIHEDKYYHKGELQAFYSDRHNFSLTLPNDLKEFMEEVGFSKIETYSNYESREVELCQGGQVIVCAYK